ncbi:alpha/beta hydrolase [Hyphococcus lacteus]|uniref:Alpha/beta hydrolase n=1 Tax=Hyphococcus lacteus TaxID=3143536 RepID=A0ABV3YZG8_9PROT
MSSRKSRSRHLIDPQLLPLLDIFPTVTITKENLAERRSRRLPYADVDSGTVVLHKKFVQEKKDKPPIELYVYSPVNAGQSLPTIFHIHGGGFVAGSAAQLETLHRKLVETLNCILISVEYRLAPETIFPGAIEDCFSGLCWVFNNANEIGVDKSRIGLLGESAGGGLAAALALMIRDQTAFNLSFQHLIYPALDDRTCLRDDLNPFVGEFLWHKPNNYFAWKALLGTEPGQANISCYAAPARATNLEGLPPTFLSVGALDLFVEENLEYGRRLMHAGVPVEMHVWPGAIHGFDLMREAHIAEKANRVSQNALHRFLWPRDD